MNTKLIKTFVFFSFLILILTGCTSGKFKKSNNKIDIPFKHNTPLIKQDYKKTGKKEINKTVERGPKPTIG